MKKDLWEVDKNDVVIGHVSRADAFKHRVWHRGVLTFVFNSEGKILVHQRTATKDIYPSYYDMTVGGGVDYPESYEEAAVREVEEEIGAKNIKLTSLFPYRYDGKDTRCFFNVYRCTYDGPLRFEKEAISSGTFVTISHLQDMMKKEKFPPAAAGSFRKYMEDYHEAQ